MSWWSGPPTKGAVSTNVRALERLGMVHPHFQTGERKDYYVAETDFWKITRAIFKKAPKNLSLTRPCTRLKKA